MQETLCDVLADIILPI